MRVGITLIILFSLALIDAREVVISETFSSLDNWTPLLISEEKIPSQYTITQEENRNILHAQSSGGASGLLYRKIFDIYDCPYLHWRWRVDHPVSGGDGRSKKTDDYSLRVYIIFEYDPENSSVLKKIFYDVLKALYGQYPPDSGLCYVWANKKWSSEAVENPFTDQVFMIAKNTGTRKGGTWQEHDANIVEDYRKHFGKDPPRRASIAIMSDSDNTGNTSEGWIDFLYLECD